MPAPGNRFANWTPDRVPIGPAAVGLGTGTTHRFEFRRDNLISFEMPMIAGTAAQLELALRLKYHLLNGGFVQLDTDRPLASAFASCKLAPGTEPQIEFSDRQMSEYTFSVQLKALSASESAGSGSFLYPAFVPNLKLWLKGDNETLAATKTDEDFVGGWYDDSGLGNDAVQANGSLQPRYRTNIVNGYPVIRYVSGQGPLQTPVIFNPATNGMTMFFVVRRFGAWRHTATFFSFATIPPTGTQANDNSIRDSGDGFYCTDQGFIGWNLTTAAVECSNGVIVTPSNTWAVGCLAMTSGLSMTPYQNGTEGTSWTPLASINYNNSLIVGTGGNGGTLNADIAEVVLYDGVLNAATRNGLTRYLGQKYGITVTV